MAPLQWRLSSRNRGRSGFGRYSAAGISLVKPLNPLVISGREVLPLVEGGKGISVSNGESSGAWAAAGGVGTFSGVNADSYTETGAADPANLSRAHAGASGTKNSSPTRSPAAFNRRGWPMSAPTAKAAST